MADDSAGAFFIVMVIAMFTLGGFADELRGIQSITTYTTNCRRDGTKWAGDGLGILKRTWRVSFENQRVVQRDNLFEVPQNKCFVFDKENWACHDGKQYLIEIKKGEWQTVCYPIGGFCTIATPKLLRLKSWVPGDVFTNGADSYCASQSNTLDMVMKYSQ